MHIWHHAKNLPNGTFGVNFALTLSIWDYIFRTNYIPQSGRDLELGFNQDKIFPQNLAHQLIYPLGTKTKIS